MQKHGIALRTGICLFTGIGLLIGGLSPAVSQVDRTHAQLWDKKGGYGVNPSVSSKNPRYTGRTRGIRRDARARKSGVRHAPPPRSRPIMAPHTTHIAQNEGTGLGIVPNPPCPAWVMRARAFCGCGVSIKVFGTANPSLFTAGAWLRFPPAAPAPGMIAANRRHVFYIQAVLGNGLVVAYDPNSGGGRTRVHVRSLAGFSVRNPRA